MKTAIDILFDVSDFMGEANRKSVAQQLLRDEILPMIDFSEITGLKTFMSSGPVVLAIRNLDLGNNSKSDFEQKINNFPMANGGAPISKAIEESLSDLAKHEAECKRIVVITAGNDSLDGLYTSAALKAANEGVQVSFVLINAAESDKNTAANAANSANGVVCNVASDGFDLSAARTELTKLSAWMKGQQAPVVAPKEEVVANEVVVPVVETVVEPVSSVNIAEDVKEEIAAASASVEEKIDQVVEEKMVEEEPVFSAIDMSQFAVEVETVLASVSETADDSELTKVVADNRSEMNGLLNATTEKVAEIIAASNTAVADLQRKMAAEIANLQQQSTNCIADLLKASNKKLENLSANSSDAFSALASQKAQALALVDQLREDDRKVIIRTNDALDKQIAEKSQSFLNTHLQKKYPGRVSWVSNGANGSKGYDFVIDDNDNDASTIEYLIACKGLVDNSKTFFMTKEEWLACTQNAKNYQVYIISNLQDTPSLTIIDNLMDWIMKGKVVPCASSNIKLKADSIVLSLV